MLTGKYFSGPPELTVPAGATREYPLVFQPTWVCEERGRLVLTNARNGDVVEYELTGAVRCVVAELICKQTRVFLDVVCAYVCVYVCVCVCV